MTQFATEELLTLDAVLAEGSFDGAARRLNLTPSAVSQRIRQLEERAGHVLVQRTQPTASTPAGLVLRQLAQQMQALQDDAAAQLYVGPGSPPLTGQEQGLGYATVAVAVNADSLATWWVPAVASFVALPGHEQVRFDARVDDQDHTAELLRAGEVHAAICAQPKPVHGCAVEPLGAMAYAAVCSPAFAQREGWAVHEGEAGLRVRVGGAALAQASCLVFNRKDGLQAAFLAQSASGKRQQIQRPHHLPSASGFVLGALHGLGWGMCPERMCESHLASGELLRIGLPDPVGAAATPDGLRVPLYWQHVRWQTQLMLRLTRHIRETASLNLNP